MSEPTKEVIERVKAQHADRALRLVELQNEDDTISLIMTGPSRPEYTKFQDEIQGALEKKNEKEKVEAIRLAVERAALAQIRWPDRPQVAALFEKHPVLVTKLADVLHDMAGDSFEVRSKKL